MDQDLQKQVLDVRKVIEKSTSKVSLRDLEKKGFRQVKVLRAGDINQLIDEINTLVERGERERLADPWFLHDLRTVIDKYDYPWRERILYEDFSGPDTLPGSPWEVTAGEFRIDWRYGLRSVVIGETPEASQPAQPQQQQGSDDAAKILFGVILQQALENQQSGTTSQSPPPSTTPEPSHASVAAELPIPNAFAIQIEI